MATALDAQQTGGGSQREGSPPILELQKGIRLLRIGEPSAAAKVFESLSKVDQTNSISCYYEALAHAQLGDSSACLKALYEAVERGHPQPLTLKMDPAFLEFQSQSDLFRVGFESLLRQVEQRLLRGLIPPHDFSQIEYFDLEGEAHSLSRYAGKDLAILFVRSDDPQDLSAVWALRSAGTSRRPETYSLVLVEVRGKSLPDQLTQLHKFKADTGIQLTLGLSTPEIRRALRPWREWPTLLIIDRDLKSQLVVEGFPADLESRYKQALTDLKAQKRRETNGEDRRSKKMEEPR